MSSLSEHKAARKGRAICVFILNVFSVPRRVTTAHYNSMPSVWKYGYSVSYPSAFDEGEY